MNLEKVVRGLKAVAPINLAEGWDNVGLLAEPSPPHVVGKILLTNDLTLPVMEEAVSKRADMIVSYHPPIFRPLKRLVWSNPKQKIITMAMENRVAIYSPHTCCDAIEGGVNDWLAKSLGGLKAKHPVQPKKAGDEFKVSVCFKCDQVPKPLQNCISRNFSNSTLSTNKLDVNCSSKEIPKLFEIIMKNCCAEKKLSYDDFYIDNLSPVNDKSSVDGMGRICLLEKEVPLKTLVNQVKQHVGVNNIRVAVGEKQTTETPIRSVALCAGSGSSILSGVKTDLYLTGEMSHHEILAATATGTSVILCEHNNSERGYLKEFKEQILAQLSKINKEGADSVEIVVSAEDKDPVDIM